MFNRFRLSLFLVGGLLLSFVNARGQDSLQVMEGKNTCSLGSQSSFSIQIPQVKQKEIMSAWRKYVKQGTKKSAEEDGGEIILSQAVIPALGIDTFTVYAKTEATDRGVLFTSFYHWNDSLFISSSIDVSKTEKISGFIRTFAIQEYKNAVEDELKTNQKMLKTLESNLEDLISENDNSAKKINEYKRNIEQLKSDIKTTDKELDLKSEEVIRQKLYVESYTGTPEAKAVEEKKFKDLSKQKNKLIDKKEDMYKEIDDKEKKIKDKERLIEKNTNEIIPAKKDQITAQKVAVQQVEVKLSVIK